MKLAAAEVDAKTSGIRAAARKRGLPHTTLLGRVKGTHLPRDMAHTHRQILSPEKEAALVSWCLHCSSIGFPLSQTLVWLKAGKLAGVPAPGTTWYRAFMRRHPNLRAARPRALDPKRARAFNQPTVEHFFDKLDEFCAKNDVPCEHIWNMDETGVVFSGGRNTDRQKYVVSRDEDQLYKTQSDDIRMVTVIECISTTGDRVDPTFIFKGKRIQRTWFPREPDESDDEGDGDEDGSDNGSDSDDDDADDTEVLDNDEEDGGSEEDSGDADSVDGIKEDEMINDTQAQEVTGDDECLDEADNEPAAKANYGG